MTVPDQHLAVADGAGAGAVFDRLQHGLDPAIGDHELKLDVRRRIQLVGVALPLMCHSTLGTRMLALSKEHDDLRSLLHDVSLWLEERSCATAHLG